jgi:hypothetical protein
MILLLERRLGLNHGGPTWVFAVTRQTKSSGDFVPRASFGSPIAERSEGNHTDSSATKAISRAPTDCVLHERGKQFAARAMELEGNFSQTGTEASEECASSPPHVSSEPLSVQFTGTAWHMSLPAQLRNPQTRFRLHSNVGL